MALLALTILVFTSLIATLPSASAQTTSTLSCFSVGAFGTKVKPTETLYPSTTITEYETRDEILTTTIDLRAPDHTITAHRKIYRTEWHEEYTATYTSIIWHTKTEASPRPTMTITVPESIASPVKSLEPDVDIPKRQQPSVSSGPTTTTTPTSVEPELLGEVLLPTPEEKPTKYDNVFCSVVIHTTVTEVNWSLAIVDRTRPKRTITLTRWHTEVVDEFRQPPGKIETKTKTTTYKTFTTTWVTVTPTSDGEDGQRNKG